MHDIPYVVSEDIQLLLKKWAIKHGFVLPDNNFFRHLREKFAEHLRDVFPAFESVSEDELSRGLNELVSESPLPVIALDETYLEKAPMRLRLTRTVNADLNDSGIESRFPEVRSPTVEITRLAAALKEKDCYDIALEDDVIFSGALVSDACASLHECGVTVRRVYAGIGIAEGMRRVEAQGARVQCVRSYARVIDQICERDFYPGVPFSGRTLLDAHYKTGSAIGAPYLLPFGKPSEWASIPTRHERAFSQFCIRQTIDLFEVIGELSDRAVRTCDLDRGVIGIPCDVSAFSDRLRHILI